MHIWPLHAFNLTDVKFELHIYTIFSFFSQLNGDCWSEIQLQKVIELFFEKEYLLFLIVILISEHDIFQVVNINSVGFYWISTTGIVSNILKRLTWLNPISF